MQSQRIFLCDEMQVNVSKPDAGEMVPAWQKSFSVCKEDYLTENKEWVAMEPVGR